MTRRWVQVIRDARAERVERVERDEAESAGQVSECREGGPGPHWAVFSFVFSFVFPYVCSSLFLFCGLGVGDSVAPLWPGVAGDRLRSCIRKSRRQPLRHVPSGHM